MPCNSDYMEAGSEEIQLSEVQCLLDELAGEAVKKASHRRGYHPKIYNRHITKKQADAMVYALCEKLEAMTDPEIQRHSLELQIWWRDHQIIDRKRRAVEELERQAEQRRKAALGKLSAEDRKALGI